VEALFDVERSSALTERQKRRVIARAGPVLRAVAQDERSQWRNRELATERVALRQALWVERRRRRTEPTPASRERRLEQKRRRSETKRLRRPPS
jgi:ribosome-associated protein